MRSFVCQQILIAVTVALALFLCGLMLYFWKKTQRLEYKYMKLVQSAGGRDGEGEAELAPAESCALDDGEEEEIQFSQPLAAGILNRIKAMTGKVGKLEKSINVNAVISKLCSMEPKDSMNGFQGIHGNLHLDEF
jgi:hypothetical protein